jgi:hypothetical protein
MDDNLDSEAEVISGSDGDFSYGALEAVGSGQYTRQRYVGAGTRAERSVGKSGDYERHIRLALATRIASRDLSDRAARAGVSPTPAAARGQG